MSKLQKEDDEVRELMERVSEGMIITEEDDVAYMMDRRDERCRLIVPRFLVGSILSSVHEQFGHAGSYKMHKYVFQIFYWKYQRRDIKSFLRHCDTCQRTKCLNYKTEGAFLNVRTNKPNELIAVDFYGPLPGSVAGVKYIFVVLDIFSKLVTLYPIKKANKRICLDKLRSHYFIKVGKPCRVLSDHGTQFTSPFWKAELESEGVEAIFSSIRHPQSNPVERIMRELGRFFRTYCAERHTAWARYVPTIRDCLNLMSHQSTGAVPYELHYGRSPLDRIIEMFPRLKYEIPSQDIQIQLTRENLRRAWTRQSDTQKGVSKVSLAKEDLVLLRVPHLSDASQSVIYKFFHLFEGPYRIQDIINQNAFVLVHPDDNDRIKGTYNRIHLRKYYPKNLLD